MKKLQKHRLWKLLAVAAVKAKGGGALPVKELGGGDAPMGGRRQRMAEGGPACWRWWKERTSAAGSVEDEGLAGEKCAGARGHGWRAVRRKWRRLCRSRRGWPGSAVCWRGGALRWRRPESRHFSLEGSAVEKERGGEEGDPAKRCAGLLVAVAWIWEWKGEGDACMLLDLIVEEKKLMSAAAILELLC